MIQVIEYEKYAHSFGLTRVNKNYCKRSKSLLAWKLVHTNYHMNSSMFMVFWFYTGVSSRTQTLSMTTIALTKFNKHISPTESNGCQVFLCNDKSKRVINPSSLFNGSRRSNQSTIIDCTIYYSVPYVCMFRWTQSHRLFYWNAANHWIEIQTDCLPCSIAKRLSRIQPIVLWNWSKSTVFPSFSVICDHFIHQSLHINP